MPTWIFSLFFLCGFLLILGLACVFLSGQTLVDARLAQISGQTPRKSKRPGTAAATQSAPRQVARALLFEVSRFLPIRKPAPQLRQRMAMAGFYEPEAARVFVGAKLVLGVGLFVLYNALSFVGHAPRGRAFLLSLLLFAIGFILPNLWLSRRTRRRRDAIWRSLPDFVDLLIICVEAGQGLDQALARVGWELKASHPIFSQELHILNLELRAGKSRAEALRNLYGRSGVEELKSFAAMLIQADRYGVSIAHSLRVFSEGLRTSRRQAAEEAAAKTALKIAFPLVLFIFPALMVIILGPAALQLLSGAFWK